MSPFPFILRTLLLFGGLVWALWALITRRGSAVAISSAGLIFLMIMNFMVLVDWVVSLDASFHSSGFGLYAMRSEEHTSELQSLMRLSYAVFCLNKKIQHQQ